MKPTLYTLIGIQGAGKSTFAKAHPECVVISSDAIRQEIFGTQFIEDDYVVFKIARRRALDALAEGKSVIYDATNLRHKNRRWCCKADAFKVAVFFNTPYELCQERNSKRESNCRVPEEAIERARSLLIPPTLAEGFDEIIEIN